MSIADLTIHFSIYTEVTELVSCSLYMQRQHIILITYSCLFLSVEMNEINSYLDAFFLKSHPNLLSMDYCIRSWTWFQISFQSTIAEQTQRSIYNYYDCKLMK